MWMSFQTILSCLTSKYYCRKLIFLVFLEGKKRKVFFHMNVLSRMKQNIIEYLDGRSGGGHQCVLDFQFSDVKTTLSHYKSQVSDQ